MDTLMADGVLTWIHSSTVMPAQYDEYSWVNLYHMVGFRHFGTWTHDTDDVQMIFSLSQN